MLLPRPYELCLHARVTRMVDRRAPEAERKLLRLSGSVGERSIVARGNSQVVMVGRDCTEVTRISARGGAYVRPSVQLQEISPIRLGRKRLERIPESNIVVLWTRCPVMVTAGTTIPLSADRGLLVQREGHRGACGAKARLESLVPSGSLRLSDSASEVLSAGQAFSHCGKHAQVS